MKRKYLLLEAVLESLVQRYLTKTVQYMLSFTVICYCHTLLGLKEVLRVLFLGSCEEVPEVLKVFIVVIGKVLVVT